MSIKAGKTYNVDHVRKGKFVLHVTKTNEDWITGRLVNGEPTMLNILNAKNIGEEMTVRASFCTFTEIE